MFGLLLNKEQPLLEDIKNCLVGNLSRCNGYRAVLEAYQQFTEIPNNEKDKFESSLPSLVFDSSETVNIGCASVQWYKVSSLAQPYTLQQNGSGSKLVFGLPNLNQLKDVKIVYDVSNVELPQIGCENGLEIPGNATLTHLVGILTNHANQINPGVGVELNNALQSIKTLQYRNSCSVVDVLQESSIFRAILMSLNASLNIMKESKTVKAPLTEANTKGIITSINIPAIPENRVLLFQRVAGRKANGYDFHAGLISLDITNGTFANSNATSACWKTKEQRLEVVEKLLNENSTNNLENIIEKLKSLIFLQQGIITRLLIDLQDLLASQEHIAYYRHRNKGMDPFCSTQFTEQARGPFSDLVTPLGKSEATTQGIDCACGEAVFTEDLPRFEHELYLAPVLAQVAHGKIKSVDASAALRTKGVVRYISARDVPKGKNKFKVAGLEDEKVFADNIIEFDGDMIGAILAVDEATARQAAEIVEVEIEELVPIVSLKQAIKEGTFWNLTEENMTSIEKGNVNDALEKSDRVVNGYIQTPRQEHFYEETNNILVVPKGERNEIDVYAATSNQFVTQHTIASVLELPFHKVNIFTRRVGCSFGGKITKQMPFYAAVALAAKLENKPIRCRLTRDQDMRLIGQRGEFYGRYTAGIKDGKLTGVSFDLCKNAGWNTDHSPGIMAKAMCQFENCYNFPNMVIRGKVYQTHTASNTAFRAYGAPPAMIITENMIFDICAEVGCDPLEFRYNNLQEEGYKTAYNQVMIAEDVSHKLCLDEMVEKTNYHELRKDVLEFNKSHKHKKRGIALIPNKYGVAMPTVNGQGACLLNIYLDGTVTLAVNGIELGQGLYVKMMQIASHELNIPMSKIHMSCASNKATPNPIPTGASATADLSGNAVRNACKKINDRMAPLREALPDATWEDYIDMAFARRINLSATGYYRTPDERYTFDPITKVGQRWWYFTCGAAFSLVEVDLLTGEHTLVKANVIMDIGESINPAIDIANIEGAFIQGYGYMAMEDTLFNQKGRLVSRGHDEYNIPSIADCPREFNVHLLKGNKSNQCLLYSSKGIGEPPFFSGASVFFAVKDALLSAHREAGSSGTINLEAPCTPTNVLKAIKSEKIL